METALAVGVVLPCAALSRRGMETSSDGVDSIAYLKRFTVENTAIGRRRPGARFRPGHTRLAGNDEVAAEAVIGPFYFGLKSGHSSDDDSGERNRVDRVPPPSQALGNVGMSVQPATRETPSVVARALATIGDIATLPEVTVRIIEIVEDPNSTARDLHQVIKTDPALSAKVLKVVNSAFYGLPGQIASVDRAIVLLGMSAVKNISVAASIARLFKSGKMSEQFTAKDLWRHSVAVAVASRMVAKAAGQPAGLDEVFLAGLIHDIGVLVERQAFSELLTEVISRCTAGEGRFAELEVQIIGADHQAFGDALTTKWKFPRHLRAVVGFHHSPEKLSVELRKLGFTVRMADILCCQQKLGFYLTAEDVELTEEMTEAVGIDAEQVEKIKEELPGELDNAEQMLIG